MWKKKPLNLTKFFDFWWKQKNSQIADIYSHCFVRKISVKSTNFVLTTRHFMVVSRNCTLSTVVWNLRKFSLTLFWQKFRESNVFTKEITNKLISRNFFFDKEGEFLVFYTAILEIYFCKYYVKSTDLPKKCFHEIILMREISRFSTLVNFLCCIYSSYFCETDLIFRKSINFLLQ